MKLCSGLKGADRLSFIILQIAFTISGILMLALGVLMNFIYYQYLQFMSGSFYVLATYLVVLGTLIPLLPVLAYYGFAKGTYCKIAFLIPLIVISVLEIIQAVRGFEMTGNINWVAYMRYPSSYGNMRYGDESLMPMWNTVQREFHCCGIYEYEGWMKNLPRTSSGELPLSCCDAPKNATGFKCTKDAGLYETGCIYVFGNFLRTFTGTAACLLLLGFISQAATSIFLVKKIRFNKLKWGGCGCSYSQFSYRSYDCNCKSIVLVSKGCDSQNHLYFSSLTRFSYNEDLEDEQR